MKKKQQPYLFKTIKVKRRYYNPDYGDDRICQCGHPYNCHFDSDADMLDLGCNSCECFVFMEKGIES